MSILTPSKSMVLAIFIRGNFWRIINSAIIFFSFFIPWIGGSEDPIYVFTGFRALGFYQYIGWFEVFVQNRDFSERVRLGLVFGQFVIGSYTILIYSALNLVRATLRPKAVNKPDWLIAALCLIALGIGSLWNIAFLDEGWQGLSFTFWGYWLVLIGLVSSITLEISYYISKRA